MTDETTDEQPEAADAEAAAATTPPATRPSEPGTDVAVAEPAAADAPRRRGADRHARARTPDRDPVAERLLLPLLLPLVSIGAILVLVLNISRLLLAGGESGAVAHRDDRSRS